MTTTLQQRSSQLMTLSGIATVFSLSALALLFVATSPTNAECEGTGEVAAGIWAITCAGSCPEDETCPIFNTAGEPEEWTDTNGYKVGLGAYWECKCGTAGSPCCHYVLRKGENDTSHIPDTDGSCPGCPLQNFCELNVPQTQAGCPNIGEPV